MWLSSSVLYGKTSFFQRITYFRQVKVCEETRHFSDMAIIVLYPLFPITFFDINIEYSIGTQHPTEAFERWQNINTWEMNKGGTAPNTIKRIIVTIQKGVQRPCPSSL
jgi:hypothetical protein